MASDSESSDRAEPARGLSMESSRLQPHPPLPALWLSTPPASLPMRLAD